MGLHTFENSSVLSKLQQNCAKVSYIFLKHYLLCALVCIPFVIADLSWFACYLCVFACVHVRLSECIVLERVGLIFVKDCITCCVADYYGLSCIYII